MRLKTLLTIIVCLVLALVLVPQASAAGELENVITERQFNFEIDGKSITLASDCVLEDETMGDRKENNKSFTVTKPQFSIDLELDVKSDEDKKVEDTNEETGNYYKIPTNYESIKVDSRNAGQAATEEVGFTETECEYL